MLLGLLMGRHIMTKSEVELILSKIDYADGYFRVIDDWIQFCKPVIDVDTGQGHIHRGRKWRISSYMTRSEVVQTAFKAIITFEEHEVREKFTYEGQRIFGPHFDVDRLADLCREKTALDIREAL